MPNPKPRWKKIAERSYECKSATSQAFVFGANRPQCLWAWSVYWSGGHSSWVENSFLAAKRKAEETMREVSNAKS